MKPENSLQQWQRQEQERQTQAKPCYDNFDAYVKDYPEAEKYRLWVEDGILLPTYPNWCGMPGNYVTASIHPWQGYHYVVINDCDDGMCKKQFATRQEAEQELANLKALAPFVMYDLKDFGYTDFN